MYSHKRQRGFWTDRLTGRSGDVNPQKMKLQVSASANNTDSWNTFDVTQSQIPVQRLNNAAGSMVLEVLRITFNYYGPDKDTFQTTLKDGNIMLLLSTQPLNAADTGGSVDRDADYIFAIQFDSVTHKVEGGTVIVPITGEVDGQPLTAEFTLDLSLLTHKYVFIFVSLYRLISNLATSSVSYNQWTKIHDFTDGAGHGLLIAADKLYAAVSTRRYYASGHACNFDILYRWKNVGLAEYVGIVQTGQ